MTKYEIVTEDCSSCNAKGENCIYWIEGSGEVILCEPCALSHFETQEEMLGFRCVELNKEPPECHP